jgi:Dolichyl-phosphate-mannose-protein mannosyltransferase
MVSPSIDVETMNEKPRRPAITQRILGSTVGAVVAVSILAAVISISSFLYFFANDMTNVYGDGVAHLNIARKVVDSPDDSLWRRYIQIGSPWLPLQTVLMLPLVTNDRMWRTGVAGSIVSMISFVIASVSLYLLAATFYRKEDTFWRTALPAMTAGIFLFNPSVLYMQSTPMAELVFMAAVVAAVYLLQRWVDDQTSKRLVVAGVTMAVATLARYEAWPVAALSVVIVALTSSGDWRQKIRNSALFSTLVAVGPCYWLWHNWAIYGNALEFLTGPNSARGIYLQNRINFGWSTMFVGHAGLDFLVMAAATGVCAGPLVLLLSMAGLAIALVAKRKSLVQHSPLALLILPFFFHVFSLYRGEIQVFPLSAFGLLNIRYGLPHVPGVALFAPAVVFAFKGSVRRWAGVVVCLIVVAQYWFLVSEGTAQLAIYQEGYRNGVNARPAGERARVASFLIASPPRRLILMHTGALGPVVSEGGLRFSEIIHEGSLRWHQLDDGIPKDVATVMVQLGDPLDVRVRETPALERDLNSDFQEKLSVGNIKMFERKRGLRIED